MTACDRSIFYEASLIIRLRQELLKSTERCLYIDKCHDQGHNTLSNTPHNILYNTFILVDELFKEMFLSFTNLT